MNDLTRWNRAGLARFRYVDGNAVTFLEELRRALAERFPAAGSWLDVVPSSNRPAPAGTEAERLLAQYGAPRADLAWELTRSFARACHLFGEHLDAYANEGFLGTATQWESVRRLVAMLDVHPAPPASAATLLAFDAKPGLPGKVARGFQVRHSPPDGGAPVLFETLEDLELDPALNALRPHGFDRDPEELRGRTLVLAGRVKGIESGQPLVIEDDRNGALHAYLIRGVLEEAETTTVEVAPAIESRVPRGHAWIHAVPKDRLAPAGPASKGATVGRVLHLAGEPDGLLPGEVVWIGDGQKSLFRRVERVRGRQVTFSEAVGDLRVEQAEIGRPVVVPVTSLVRREIAQPAGAEILVVKVEGHWSRLAGGRVADHAAGGRLRVRGVFGAEYHPVVQGRTDDPDSGYTLLRLEQRRGTDSRNPQALLAPPLGRGAWQVDRFLLEERDAAGWRAGLVTARPKQAAAGDLAVVVREGRVAWARLGAVEIDEEAKQATLRAAAPWRDRGGPLFFLSDTIVYSHFTRAERLVGWDRNARPLTGNRVPLASPLLALRPGRRLLLTLLDVPVAAAEAEAVALKGRALVLDRPVPAGTRFDNLVILANVAPSGHGETKPEKVLGSGDASLSGQEMVLEEKGLSFVADSAQPSGVRAGVEVKVGERIWRQVATLADSAASDPHYTVRMTEEGWLRFAFGDGRHGRRLPTGVNNVRATFRVGAGLAGNLPPGRLEKPIRPHPRIAAVRQPLPAAGGNDLEGVESLRATAPASVSTLGRAVSLEDFGRLAASQSSVWRARAFALPTGLGRHESVRVAVVPAGGGPLGGLAGSIRAFLETHALPGVELRVERYRPVALALAVTVEVKTAERSPQQVAAAVRARLLETFGLSSRDLGQDLRLAEVFRVVEGVEGVESSTAVLDGDPRRTRVPAPPDGVAALDGEGSSLTVNFREHEL